MLNLPFIFIVENQVSSAVQTSITEWLKDWKPDSTEPMEPLSDIISWNSIDAERDKESGSSIST
jgi:hypothetical protein